MVVVDAEEVVEVATNILGGNHRGRQVEFVFVLGEWREDAWQNGLLNLTSHSQVGLQRFQLRVLFLRLLDIFNLLYGLLDGHAEVVQVDGFRGKVEGTVVHGRTYVRHVTVGRHHDALQGGVLQFVDFREQRQSVHLGHVDVA